MENFEEFFFGKIPPNLITEFKDFQKNDEEKSKGAQQRLETTLFKILVTGFCKNTHQVFVNF